MSQETSIHVLTTQPRWVNKSGDIRSEDATERAKFFSRGRWSRVSGPIDVVRCKSLVDQIDNEIGRISNFVKDVTELEVPRKEQQHQIDSTYWMTVRDHAHRVFKGFESRWSRPCTCHQLHRASLQLHVRDTETRCDCSDHRLKCILSFQNDSNGSAGTPPLWDWRDIEIEPKPVDMYVDDCFHCTDDGKTLITTIDCRLSPPPRQHRQYALQLLLHQT